MRHNRGQLTAGLLVISAVLTACVTVQPIGDVKTVSRSTIAEERRIERNYEIGKEAIAYVGEPMVLRREFVLRNVLSTQVGGLYAANDFTVIYPPFGIRARVKTGAQIEVVGTIEREGKRYSIVNFQSGVPGVGLLVDADGAFEGSGLSLTMGKARMGYTYRVEPVTTRLVTTSAAASTSADAHGRVELVFISGSREAVRLRYQEFGAANAAQPTISEEVAYKLENPVLQVRSIRLRVLAADHERVRYVVLADEL